MKKGIITAAFLVVGLVLLKFSFTYFYNEWVIAQYNKGDYSENFNLLELFNVVEPYIVHYNNGNVYYQQGDYEEAIDEYETALEKNPPEGKECPIRINLALSKLALLDDDALSKEKIDDTIEVLKDCLEILSEDGCATDDGDGHNNRAQRLYDEIKEMLEQAEDEKEQQEQNDPSDPSDPSDSSDPSDGSGSDGSGSAQSENSDGSGSDPSDGSGGQDPDESRRQSERESQIESEMNDRMSKSNDQRQAERRRSQQNSQDWNWYYDDMPVW